MLRRAEYYRFLLGFFFKWNLYYERYTGHMFTHLWVISKVPILVSRNRSNGLKTLD